MGQRTIAGAQAEVEQLKAKASTFEQWIDETRMAKTAMFNANAAAEIAVSRSLCPTCAAAQSAQA
jgi:hypothetical protein